MSGWFCASKSGVFLKTLGTLSARRSADMSSRFCGDKTGCVNGRPGDISSCFCGVKTDLQSSPAVFVETKLAISHGNSKHPHL